MAARAQEPAELKTLHFISIVNAVALLITLAISYRFYLGSRLYPFVPLLGSTELSAQVHTPLFVLILLALAATFLNRQSGWAWGCFAGFILAAIVLDQGHLSPYVCIFVSIAVALAAPNYGSKDDVHKSLNAIRLLLCFLYFYSGFYKINKLYILGVTPWVFGPVLSHLPLVFGHPMVIWTLGLGSAVFELALGLLLAVPRTRKWGAYGAIAMHCGILLLIGPLGINFGPVVWAWNFAEIAFVYCLFLRPSESRQSDVVKPKSKVHYAIWLLFGFAPATNMLGLWDSKLSFHAFSAGTMDGVIVVDEKDQALLPEEMRQAVEKGNEIHYFKWAMSNYGVAAYPERRVYQSIMTQVCHRYSLSDRARVVILEPATWPGGVIYCHAYNCEGEKRPEILLNSCTKE